MKPIVLSSTAAMVCMLISVAAGAQTGIGTLNPHPSAELDVSSATRGFLPPRMTAVQRLGITGPAAGLMVYDIDSAGCMLYNGSGWSRLGSGGASSQYWTQAGNHIYSNNSGNTGIGTSNPELGKLHVETTQPSLYSIYAFSNSATTPNFSIVGEVTGTQGAGIVGTSYSGVNGTSPYEVGKYGVVATAGNDGVAIGGFVNSGIAIRARVMNGTGKAISSEGPLQFKGISEGAGKVLTSDANGNATWQTPAAGGGGASQWTTSGDDIYHNNPGKVLIGGLTSSDPGAKGKLWVNETNSFGLGIKSWTSAAYGTAIYAADSGLSGNPAGCIGCGGSAAMKGYSKYGDALFAYSSNGRGIYLMGGSNFYPAMVIDVNPGMTGNALELNGKIKIADGSQVANAVLTCDANGLASWMPPAGGGGGGTTYTAGSGISIAGSVISAADNSAFNEIQTISLSGGTTLNLSNGGGSVTLPSAAPTGWGVSGNDVYNSGFNSGGKVTLGSPNPYPNTRLTVTGASGASNAAMFSAGTGGTALIVDAGNVGFGTFAPAEKLEVCGNVKVNGSVNASGNINANQSITCSSDIRYKKDIITLSGALDSIQKMRGVTYNWKRAEFPAKEFNDRLQIGFIAQEVEQVYPELVYTDKDGYKSVDYAKLTPILLEAVKQLKIQNDVLQQGNDDLNARTASIEAKLSRLEQLLNGKQIPAVTSITASKN